MLASGQRVSRSQAYVLAQRTGGRNVPATSLLQAAGPGVSPPGQDTPVAKKTLRRVLRPGVRPPQHEESKIGVGASATQVFPGFRCLRSKRFPFVSRVADITCTAEREGTVGRLAPACRPFFTGTFRALHVLVRCEPSSQRLRSRGMPFLTHENLAYLARATRRWLYGELRSAAPTTKEEWWGMIGDRTSRAAWLFVFGLASRGCDRCDSHPSS
ncbi:hypothetical protein VT03_05800 [Planctomyces sp. SH-PL14]|nr:hypothetical protein VT03_05800 [Planctomyces sp. SH-PL14]